MKRLLLHLPLIGFVVIFGFFALVDAGVFESVRNESTFGWMVAFWYPLGVLLALAQIAIWVGLLMKRRRKDS